jgi:hypothetical protein
MSTIRFNTVIGEDQTIRPPEGVRLTPGKAEIIVMQVPDGAAGSSQEEASAPRVPEVASDLARFAREQDLGELPADLALNHDHYLHGAPKGIDQS